MMTEQQREVKTCPWQKRCGGCAYMGMPYEKQLEEKRRELKKTLKGLVSVSGMLGMEDPYHYRCKVHAAFSRKRDGTVLSGMYEEGTHRVVPADSCLLENEKADQVIRDIRELLGSFKITVYNEDTGYGLLRHVMVRVGHATGQILVVLVCASPVFPSKNNFVKALRSRHPEIASVVLNVNDRHTSMVLGKRDIVLYGKGYIEDELCGCTFRISPQSFYQVNPRQTQVLYEKAIDLAGLTGKERVLDAYCGTGTIGIIAAKHAGEVIGVEQNPDAVRDAIVNARRNQTRNIRFYQDDAGEFITRMAQSGEREDVVFLDPPRAGSSEAFLQALVKLSPSRVVYISCEPETLARDLGFLMKNGYRCREGWGVDLFGWTKRMEAVVLLSLRKKNEN